MKELPERDPALRLIDAVLRDLAVRSAMHVGRRRQDGDAKTFVIQTGEDGRYRVPVPDLKRDTSVDLVVAEVQAHLERVLGVPVPVCPRHEHALMGRAQNGSLTWVCPEGKWRCALGEYEELTWPQLDVDSLAPILARRLHRRGAFPAVSSIGVSRSGDERVAEFGISEVNDELLRILSDVAAPLRVQTYTVPKERPRRVSA